MKTIFIYIAIILGGINVFSQSDTIQTINDLQVLDPDNGMISVRDSAIIADTTGWAEHNLKRLNRELRTYSQSPDSSVPQLEYTDIQPIENYATKYSEEENKPELDLRFASSYIVGEIPLSIENTPLGSLNASVPIEVPPGVAGMEPRLHLSYSNASGNGIGGYGWSLGGLSIISHRNLTRFTDNKVAPAKDDVNGLVLDGKRLILKQTLNPNSFLFHLESTAGGTTATGNTSQMVVKYANGLIGTFDNWTNTKTLQLSRLEDRFGNYIDYYYFDISGYAYLGQIGYGGNLKQGKPHVVYINLTYEDRHDEAVYYNIGAKITVTKRLKAISTPDRTYTLTYAQKHFSMLTKVDCEVNNGNISAQLTPLEFTYNNDSQDYGLNKTEGILRNYFPDSNADNLIAMTGRLTDDGLSDGLVFHKKRKYYDWGQRKGDPYITMHSEYNEDDDILLAPNYEDALGYFGCYAVKAEQGYRGMVMMNADNNQDTQEPVFINSFGSYGGYQTIRFRIFQGFGLAGNGICSSKTFTIPSQYSYNQFYSASVIEFSSGDFLGFGKDLVCGVQKQDDRSTLYSAIHLFDLKEQKNHSVRVNFRIDANDKIVTLDYDSDGKTEIFHFHASGFDVYSLESTSSTSLAFNMVKVASCGAVTKEHFDQEDKMKDSAGEWNAKRKVLFGDINGDGRMDVLVTGQYGTKDGVQRNANDLWTQCLATGAGFEVSRYSMPTTVWLNTYKDVFMHDLNGDGLVDIVSTSNGNLQILVSDGKRISDSKKMVYVTGGLDPNGKFFTVGVRNFNHERIILYLKDNKLARIRIANNEIVNALLGKAKDSLGKETEVKYSRTEGAGSYSSFYSKGYGAQFPFLNFDGYHWLVSNISTRMRDPETNAPVTIQNSDYIYHNAVIHKQGLGFCGFENVSVIDHIRAIQTSTTYDPFNWGVVKETDSPMAKVTNQYNVSLTDQKEPVVRLVAQTEENKLTGFVIEKANTYDKYGNILSATSKCGFDYIQESKNTYLHVTTGEYNLIGLPATTYIKNARDKHTSHSIVEMSTRTYNALHQVSEIIDEMNNKVSSSRRFAYDNWSNIVEESNAPYGIEKHRTNVLYTYTPDGRFVASYTNELGQVSTNVYSDNFLLSSSIDYNNNRTDYEYDALRRVVKTSYPDGEIIETERIWNFAFGATYSIATQPHYAPMQAVYFDALNREIVSSTKRFDGSFLYTKNVFNAKGQVVKSYLPFKGMDGSQFDSYQYDRYGRKTLTTFASGKEESIAYNRDQVTIVRDGASTTKTYDASGALMISEDAGGEIMYGPRVDGQLILAFIDGNATLMMYDDYGRRISIEDPSSGVTTFEYDDDNLIQTQTDALNNKTICQFDKFGRILSKEVNGLTPTLYTYDPKHGKIAGMNSGNENIKWYSYDNLGRIATDGKMVTMTRGVKWFMKSYTYNPNGVASILYSGSNMSGTLQNYYTDGYLTNITFEDGYLSPSRKQELWELKEEDDMGRTTSINLQGITQTVRYDANGYLAGQKMTKGSTLFQDVSYAFDPTTGNLTSRTDNKYGNNESFSYDGLNRLTGVNINGTNNVHYAYHDNGNMRENSSVGSFFYDNKDGKQPYALTGATLAANNRISSNEQTIEYNAFQRPSKITEPAQTTHSYTYNNDGVRTKYEKANNGVINYTKCYLEGEYEYEEESGTTRLFLGGDAYSAFAVYERNSTGTLYCLGRDHLGSITQVIDGNGVLREERSFDAWGNLRDPRTLEVYDIEHQPKLFFGRGFTGHEHLQEAGLINMNARLYDPVLGRFLSPDPYVQNVDFSQNYNRYSYCLNNPLKYVDPDGELWWLIPVTIGAYLGGSSANGNFNPLKWDYNNWQTYAGIGVGGLAGWAGAGIGGSIASSAIAGGSSTISAGVAGGMVGGMVSGGINGAGMTAIMGGSFGDIMGNMTKGMVMGGFGGALSGGIGAAIGDFSGVSGGAFKNGMYELGHSALKGAATGLAGGAMMAAMEQDASYLWKGALTGAALSTGMAGLKIGLMGSTILPSGARARFAADDAAFGIKNNYPIYRRGGIMRYFTPGITLGRNMMVDTRYLNSQNASDRQFYYETLAHERAHIYQQKIMGSFNFYKRTLYEYLINPGYSNNPYGNPNCLDYWADQYMNLTP